MQLFKTIIGLILFISALALSVSAAERKNIFAILKI